MSTPRTFTYEYTRDPDTVARLLQDPEFIRYRAADGGERNVEVTVRASPDGVRVVVARDKEVDLPAFAKHLFTPANRVVDDITWHHDGQHWVGEYTIEVVGIPGEVKGKSKLLPTPAGTQYVSSFEVTARIPLIGGKLEKFVADQVEGTMRAHASRNAARLSS
jgi:Protein of unknown function (DUF2505)